MDHVNVNLNSYWYVTKYCLPIMKKNNWGRIINMNSFGGNRYKLYRKILYYHKNYKKS